MSSRRLLGAYLPAAYPERRETVAGASAVQRVADPEDGTMTLRFIVGRILRELIELAERDEDAELVDALHDALDVASPAGGLRR